MKKRQIELVVISDVHLGTFGCHADELLAYLNSIDPKKLVLNGDIMDIWQFRKKYFPATHLKVLRKIMGMATNGTEVFYIIGNHDERLRKFSGSTIGNIHFVDKLTLELDGKRAWFFHGDVFDISIHNAKWAAKLGRHGYHLLIFLNRCINWTLVKLGREKYSLSKKIKRNVKGAVRFIEYFERTVKELAIDKGYDYVVCGHIHQPKKEVYENEQGQCTYLNSGDWIENLTALEYTFKRWKLYRYSSDKLSAFFADEEIKGMDIHELLAATSINIRPPKKTKL
ncbi:UDP-2,3-diacylglucosamine diphosphatase [Arenibacter sp. TNZ]|uniref:UDP-2,3-diacylglucosamine diphosphatase n=1 Tax=Arenibacter TaxID=178469 RepID=UPI000CD489CD|nr:UDP-2,3-diacylglucosamine diphosphatase [Arenibacter catalasegens]MCM4171622.1 UDP-2,3-diacylglucosamine diphosphatase [Arenibacter sp. TNZ]